MRLTPTRKLRALLGTAFLLAAAALPAASRAGEVLQQVVARGTLRVAVMGSLPPYISVAPSGELQGYDIDIAKSLAASLGVKPEFVIVDSAGRIAALQTRKADLAISDLARTVQRALVIGFTAPYLISAGQLLVRADSPAKVMADTNDPKFRIATNRGGASAPAVTAALPKASLVLFNTSSDTFSALTSGQVDAIALDGLFNAQMMKTHPGELRVLPGTYIRSEVAIGAPAGDPDWLRVVDLWVEQFNASGENKELFRKWFGFDAPPIQTPY